MGRLSLIVQLALFSGMRPGEILAPQWKHVAEIVWMWYIASIAESWIVPNPNV